MSTASVTDPTFLPARIPLVLIVSGPAGAGKTSLVNGLLARARGFRRAITCTCRPPRPGEVDGVDYQFLRPEEFARRLAAGEFLEHARVYGFQYGMPVHNVTEALRQHQDLVINIDVQGAATIRARARQLSLADLGGPSAPGLTLADLLVSVFLMPASLATLEERLRKRGTDDAATIERRLAVVRQEMDRWREYDYRIVSGAPAEDVARLEAIVTAERLATRRLLRWVDV